MASYDSLYKEFEKLKKSDLIDIMIKKKISSDVKVCEGVREFLSSWESKSPNESADEHKVRLTVVSLECELKCAKTEIECYKKLNEELTKSIGDKDFIIKLLNKNDVCANNKLNSCGIATSHTVSLKSKQTDINVKHVTREKDIRPDNDPSPGTSSVLTTFSKDQVQQGIKAAQNNILSPLIQKPHPSSESTSTPEKWTRVSHGRRNKPIVGSNNQSTDIQGVPKKVVLHVSRVGPETDAETLRKYIEPHFSEAICVALPSKFSEKYSSFKVTIYDKNFKKAMDPSIWPENSYIQRFLFWGKKTQTTASSSTALPKKDGGRRFIDVPGGCAEGSGFSSTGGCFSPFKLGVNGTQTNTTATTSKPTGAPEAQLRRNHGRHH